MMPRYRVSLVVWLLCGFTQAALSGSADERYTEGLQYQRIEPPQPLSSHEGHVEVVEMFLYACPHCYEFEPKIAQWLQDKPYIDFRRVPAIVGPTWADQARAFYIARELGKPDQLNEALFKTIHEGGEQIYNEYGVVKFFTGQGYGERKIVDLYLSPKIAAAVNEARRLTVKYGLRGVPAVVVNGKYVTAPYFVRNQEEMLDVLDHLINKERGELKQDTRANNTGLPGPVRSKALAVPADPGIRIEDLPCLETARSQAIQPDPELPFAPVESKPFAWRILSRLSMVDGQLDRCVRGVVSPPVAASDQESAGESHYAGRRSTTIFVTMRL